MLGCRDGRRNFWWWLFWMGCVCSSCACGAGWSGAAYLALGLRLAALRCPCDRWLAGFFLLAISTLVFPSVWCCLWFECVFYGNVISGNVVSSGIAPSQSCAGWVVSRNFLSNKYITEHLHSTILFAPQNYRWQPHKPMETSFHLPLTLVPLLANYPHSHYSPPSLGVPPSHTPF